MSIRSRILNRLFGFLYGPLVFLHEPAGTCLFGPSWARRRDAIGRGMPPDGLVLDVGCGSGILLSGLSGRTNGAVGIDPSQTMTRRAHARGCRVVQASAASIPLANSAVSAVVCSYPGPWIRDQQVWSELDRVTVPGARITILLGGTVTRGRFSMVRSKLIALLYGPEASSHRELKIEGLGHVRIPGRINCVDDEWGQSILWSGIRADNS